MPTRAELTGAEAAVSDVIDEILGRHHGILTSAHHEADFIEWLAERGYKIVPIEAD
jgi:hypothetical protein